jgi:hypothetical protein
MAQEERAVDPRVKDGGTAIAVPPSRNGDLIWIIATQERSAAWLDSEGIADVLRGDDGRPAARRIPAATADNPRLVAPPQVRRTLDDGRRPCAAQDAFAGTGSSPD